MSVDNTTLWGIREALGKIEGHLSWLPTINENIGDLCEAVEGVAALLDNRMPENEGTPDNSDILIRRAGMTIPQFREQLRGLGVPWADTMEITPEMRKDIEEGTDWESTTELLNSEEYQALSEQVYGPEVK